jgi:hypothetical protein
LIDAALKFDPTKYGALAWSLVSFGMQLAITQKVVRDLVFESSDFLANIMVRYAAYETLYRESLTVNPSATFLSFEYSLTQVYKAILVYTAEVNSYLYEWGLSRSPHAIH